MSIVQRCTKCQWLFSLDADVCPNRKCAVPVPRGFRNLYFRTRINGKRYLKRAGRIPFHEARIKYAEWLVELGASAAPPAATNPVVGFRQIADAYLRKLRAEEKHFSRPTLHLTRMIDFWGDRPYSEITSDMIRRFQTYLRESGASPAYCDRHLQTGRAAWNHFLPDTPNPFSRVKLYRPDNTLIRELTPKEEGDLLLAAKIVDPRGPPHFYEMILLAIYTGLRASNVFRLHVSEVDFDTSTIRLIQKGGLRLEVYMNSLVREALRRLTPSEAGWFFPNSKTGKPYKWITMSFATAKRLAGITRPFRWHDLRHHFAKRMAEVTGGNVLLIRTAMGHRDIHTSMKYLPPFQREVRDAVERLIKTDLQGRSSKRSSQ